MTPAIRAETASLRWAVVMFSTSDSHRHQPDRRPKTAFMEEERAKSDWDASIIGFGCCSNWCTSRGRFCFRLATATKCSSYTGDAAVSSACCTILLKVHTPSAFVHSINPRCVQRRFRGASCELAQVSYPNFYRFYRYLGAESSFSAAVSYPADGCRLSLHSQ